MFGSVVLSTRNSHLPILIPPDLLRRSQFLYFLYDFCCLFAHSLECFWSEKTHAHTGISFGYRSENVKFLKISRGAHADREWETSNSSLSFMHKFISLINEVNKEEIFNRPRNNLDIVHKTLFVSQHSHSYSWKRKHLSWWKWTFHRERKKIKKKLKKTTEKNCKKSNLIKVIKVQKCATWTQNIISTS